MEETSGLMAPSSLVMRVYAVLVMTAKGRFGM
jgi:hypothetical protein